MVFTCRVSRAVTIGLSHLKAMHCIPLAVFFTKVHALFFVTGLDIYYNDYYFKGLLNNYIF